MSRRDVLQGISALGAGAAAAAVVPKVVVPVARPNLTSRRSGPTVVIAGAG